MIRTVTVTLTVAEAKAVFTELYNLTNDHENSQEPPYHPQHHAAKRGLEKVRMGLWHAGERP